MKFRIFLVLAILAVVIPATTRSAFAAIPDPDFMQIRSVRAYESVIEENDILYLMHYDIEYGTLPGPVATTAFMFRLMASDDITELRSSVPFAFVNEGYSQGVMAIYFSASDVSLNGLIFGAGSGYTVRLQGNPNEFVIPPVIQSASISYRDTLFTRSELKSDIEAVARELEIDWAEFTTPDIDLLGATTAGNVFTPDGENYFTNAIVNLQLMVPSLFTGRSVAPEFVETTFDYTVRDQLLLFWDNTSFGVAAQNFADAWSIPRSMIYMFAVLIFMVFIGAMVVLATKSTALVPATVAIIFPMAAYIGLADLVFVALISAIATLGSVYVLWLRRA